MFPPQRILPQENVFDLLRRFSTLWQRGKKHYSDVFTVGKVPWRLSLYPKGNSAIKGSRDHVAIYLEAADAGSAPAGWKRFVEFKLAIVNMVRSHPLTRTVSADHNAVRVGAPTVPRPEGQASALLPLRRCSGFLRGPYKNARK